MTIVRHAIIASLVLLGAARAISAHPIIIHTGEILWDQRGLRIALTFDEHSLQHETDAIGGGATSREVVRMLAASIEVSAHNRGRVIPTDCDESADEYQITCGYSIAAQTNAVALLHRPTGQAAALPRQFQLTWQSPAGESTRVIRLTSRGNYAVLLRDGLNSRGDLVNSFNEPVIRLHAINESAMEIHVDYPLTALATWPNLLYVDGDMFTMQQFQQSKSAVEAWANERLSTSRPNGTPLRRAALRVMLIDPAGAAIDESNNRPNSIYTTRLRLRYTLDPAARKALSTITWRGFNAAVLRVPVLYIQDGAESLIGMVTPNQPSLKIQ